MWMVPERLDRTARSRVGPVRCDALIRRLLHANVHQGRLRRGFCLPCNISHNCERYRDGPPPAGQEPAGKTPLIFQSAAAGDGEPGAKKKPQAARGKVWKATFEKMFLLLSFVIPPVSETAVTNTNVFAVNVAEVYSEPRVATRAQPQSSTPGLVQRWILLRGGTSQTHGNGKGMEYVT